MVEAMSGFEWLWEGDAVRKTKRDGWAREVDEGRKRGLRVRVAGVPASELMSGMEEKHSKSSNGPVVL